MQGGSERRPLLGVDVGGTKILVALGDEEGRVLASRSFDSEPERGPEDACDRIAAAARELARGTEVAATVGVSAPGPLSSREGRFLDPPNMPGGWHGFAIGAALERRLDRRVEVMNDANAAAWAEWRRGVGSSVEPSLQADLTMIFFTMSTGMGAGLVVGGRLHEGRDDMAGEVGHVRLSEDGPVGFARRGSLEGYCSGPGIEQIAVKRLLEARHRGRDSLLLHLGRDPRTVGMREIGAAARAGDALAREVFAEVGERLGGYCAGLVDLLNPDLIVLGTIGRLYHDLVAPAATRAIEAGAHATATRRVRVVPAALGDDLAAHAALAPALARA